MDYTNLFEDTFSDASQFTCISVKINWTSETVPDQLYYATEYISDCVDTIFASTAGRHYNGERSEPHIHLHYIVSRYNKPSNPSQHRARWCSKDADRNLDGCSFMYQHMLSDTPRYEFLSYPLKEGHSLDDVGLYRWLKGEYMGGIMVQWLKDVGNAIYQKQVALRLRQEKSAERKQNQLLALYEIVKKQSPKSYKEMVYYLDEVYIPSLELQDYPDPKNYKTNCQKIAVKLKLLKYSELI